MNRIKAFTAVLLTIVSIFLCLQGHGTAAFVGASLGLTALGIGYEPGLCRANTLTNLIPDALQALDVVSREIVGLIPAVQLDPNGDRLAEGETIRIPVAPVNSAGGDITPAMSIPAAAYQSIGNRTHALSKKRYFPFSWNGEEKFALAPNGTGLSIMQDQIAQALRAAVGEICTDLYAAIRKGASRAYGLAGTTPFATTLAGPANVGKILTDNGTPDSDRQLIIDTTAGVNLRTLAHLNQVNTAGTDATLRRGTLLDLANFQIREDAKVTAVTKGTGTSYVSDGAFAVGDTALTIKTGSGTVLAGDVITFAGDTNKYVVKTGASAAGVITIQNPGLQATLADGVAMTIGNNFTANLGFRRNAVLLSTRLYKGVQGDLATDKQTIVDPLSGIQFEIVQWPGADMVTYHVRLAWGMTVIKPEHVAIMLG